jgi:hypothetical protein
MRYFLFTLCLVLCIFIDCSSHKNEDSIAFVRLHTNVLYDTVGNPYLNIKQYAEYRFSNRDSLFIGISENYDYFDNGYRIDNGKPFHFGLEKFCVNKIDKDFSELMKKIFNSEYEKSYRKSSGNPSTSIDDRESVMFVINRNGKQRLISYYEDYLLPEELKKSDRLIAEQINLSIPMIDKPNYTPQIILSLQNSLFREYPPPPPSSLIEFTPPIILLQ